MMQMPDRRLRRARKSPEYRLGFTEGHDSGYHKAAAFYMLEIQRLTQALTDTGYWDTDEKPEIGAARV